MRGVELVGVARTDEVELGGASRGFERVGEVGLEVELPAGAPGVRPAVVESPGFVSAVGPEGRVEGGVLFDMRSLHPEQLVDQVAQLVHDQQLARLDWPSGLTRSVVAAAVIVGTVLLSLGASFGLSVLIWQHILGTELNWMVLAMAVIILLAVGLSSLASANASTIKLQTLAQNRTNAIAIGRVVAARSADAQGAASARTPAPVPFEAGLAPMRWELADV